MRKPMWTAMMRIAMMLLAATTMLSAQSAQRPQKGEPIRHLLFQLELSEIHPQSVTVEEGWCMIRLLNGVVTSDLSLELDEESGVRVSAKQALGHSGRTSMLVYLKQGKHVLKIPGKAKWRAEIVVGQKRP